MSHSITRLATHWDAKEAYAVLRFLDHLRDQLHETYGDEIGAMLREASAVKPQNVKPSFIDDLPF